MPDWVKKAIDEWVTPAGIASGPLFRTINKAGRRALLAVVSRSSSTRPAQNLRASLPPGGGELEQIQSLLGHVSIETTEKYLGCKQRFQNAVNDAVGLDPASP